jgi:hypothetical protein
MNCPDCGGCATCDERHEKELTRLRVELNVSKQRVNELEAALVKIMSGGGGELRCDMGKSRC